MNPVAKYCLPVSKLPRNASATVMNAIAKTKMLSKPIVWAASAKASEELVSPTNGRLQRLHLIMDPENPKAVPSIPHQGKKTPIRARAPARIDTRLTLGKSARTLLANTGPVSFPIRKLVVLVHNVPGLSAVGVQLASHGEWLPSYRKLAKKDVDFP